jgi:hypothetical protein
MSTLTIDKKTGAFKIALFLCWRRPVASTMTTGQGKMGTIRESMAKLSVSKDSKNDNGTKKFAKGFDMILLWRTMWNPDDQVEPLLHCLADEQSPARWAASEYDRATADATFCMFVYQTQDTKAQELVGWLIGCISFFGHWS